MTDSGPLETFRLVYSLGPDDWDYAGLCNGTDQAAFDRWLRLLLLSFAALIVAGLAWQGLPFAATVCGLMCLLIATLGSQTSPHRERVVMLSLRPGELQVEVGGLCWCFASSLLREPRQGDGYVRVVTTSWVFVVPDGAFRHTGERDALLAALRRCLAEPPPGPVGRELRAAFAASTEQEPRPIGLSDEEARLMLRGKLPGKEPWGSPQWAVAYLGSALTAGALGLGIPLIAPYAAFLGEFCAGMAGMHVALLAAASLRMIPVWRRIRALRGAPPSPTETLAQLTTPRSLQLGSEGALITSEDQLLLLRWEEATHLERRGALVLFGPGWMLAFVPPSAFEGTDRDPEDEAQAFLESIDARRPTNDS